ncbi:hypothetical protein ASE01_03685 [Nocardioides sp. Root190]|nr:hypothetical protein ASE01_03685 [Nocardioides sp. Root190]
MDWPADSSGEGAPLSTSLPGAQQLALLRRLNEVAQAAGRTVPLATADRVLAAGVSGRGRGELALVGAAEAGRFGAPPVDPAALSDDELLRVAAGLIADDVAAHDGDPEPDRSLLERARQLRRPWVASFLVLGVQWRAEPARAGLVAHGHRPGGRRPTAYLLADDLGTVLAHAWAARAFDQGGPTWSDFVRNSASFGHLPPRADLPRMARSAAHKYGAGRVVVVLDPSVLATLLGVRSLQGPPQLGAHAIDLVRRVGEPLGLLVDAARRPELLRSTLAARLDGHGGPLPSVPPRWQSWLSSQAERTHHELAAAGYPVLGDLDLLLAGSLPSEPVVPVDAEVLDLALGLLLDPIDPPKETTA